VYDEMLRLPDVGQELQQISSNGYVRFKKYNLAQQYLIQNIY